MLQNHRQASGKRDSGLEADGPANRAGPIPRQANAATFRRLPAPYEAGDAAGRVIKLGLAPYGDRGCLSIRMWSDAQ